MAGRSARLCVALDGTDREWITRTAHSLAPEVDWLKIGLEAFVGHGPSLVRAVADHGPDVFLDLKLHDIPATVRRAAANAAASGANMVTVHASGGRGMLVAAVEGAGESRTRLPMLVVAVTVLTSLDTSDLDDLGIAGPAPDTVLRWSAMARACGVDGVVASPREAAAIRRECGDDFLIVTPGVRPTWHGRDDQRRTMTPAEAVRSGADVLVVGRPITRADAPVKAARRIAAEMDAT
jgi:orotidine-5'-phosphate decarboxylase